MAVRSVALLLAVNLAAILAIDSVSAACSDRPGTPDNVRAEALSPTAIRFHWRITTRDTEVRRYYDIQAFESTPPTQTLISNRSGVSGQGPYFLGYGGMDHFDFAGLKPGTKYCVQIMGRTEPGTQGCTSAVWSGFGCTTTPASTAPAANVPGDTCISGFVWRNVTPNDHVCVTPEIRTQVQTDNRAGVDRRASTQGNMDCQFGKKCLPENVPCKPGFVWREAVPQDFVCVTPATRQQALEDNSRARQRRVDHR